MKRILVVDDERQITRVLKASLQTSGYEVTTAQNGLEALEAVKRGNFDLLITDLVMPEMNGVELTRTLRQNSDLPIIVLSVRDSETMKIRALDAGADDYVTKPFSMPEMLARVRAQLRRTPEPVEMSRIEEGAFVVDLELHAVSLRGERLHLTPKEFDLLLVLMRNPRRVMTHRSLLRAVWGSSAEAQPEYLRVLIGQLRKKIESEAGPKYLLTEPWVGYRFEPDGEPSSPAPL